MKVHYLKEASLEEDHVEVHYRKENEEMKMIRDFFLSFHNIMGKKDGAIHRLYPGSIYYLEVVDRKLFACQEKEVYQIEGSLGHFLELYSASGFVQISKSTAVNIRKVVRMKTDFNMRLRLVMDNGEELILNRNYKKTFLEALYWLQEADYEVD